MSFGLLEIGILLFIVFVVLGPRRIEKLLRSVGRGVGDFVSELNRDGGKKMLGGGDREEDGPDGRPPG